MATTQVANTCPEPNTVPTTIQSLLLERLFIAAISALGSVTVTLGIIKWRVRKSRRVSSFLCRPSHSHQPARTSFQEGAFAVQIHEDEELSEEEETLAEDTVALEKQLACSEHRMRELEGLVESTVRLNRGAGFCPACLLEPRLQEWQGQLHHASESILWFPHI